MVFPQGQPKLSLVSMPVVGFVPVAISHRYFTWSFRKNVSVKSRIAHATTVIGTRGYEKEGHTVSLVLDDILVVVVDF